MYIEILHDETGNIKACYCADTLPVDPSSPIITFTGVPQGLRHARLNIDTAAAIEIEDASRPRAVLDQVTGQPRIVETDRVKFVMDNYLADVSGTAVQQGAVSLVNARRK